MQQLQQSQSSRTRQSSFSVSLNRWTILIHSKLLRCKIKFLRTVVRTRFMQTNLTDSAGVCTKTDKLSHFFSSKGALFVCYDRMDTTFLMNSHVVFCFLFTEECMVTANLPHCSNLHIKIISFLISISVILLLCILVLHRHRFIWMYYETKGYKTIPQIKWKKIQITDLVSQDEGIFNSFFVVFVFVALTQILHMLKAQHPRVFSCNAEHFTNQTSVWWTLPNGTLRKHKPEVNNKDGLQQLA